MRALPTNEFAPGLHPGGHRLCDIPFLLGLLGPVPRLPQIQGQKIVLGFIRTQLARAVQQFLQTPFRKRHQARFAFLTIFCDIFAN
jgi:hypothetical protein